MFVTLKCASNVQLWSKVYVQTFSFCSCKLKKKSPTWLLPTNMSPWPVQSYHYCKFDLSKVLLPLHFIMVRLRVSASEIAGLLLRWRLRLFSALAQGSRQKRKSWKMKGLNPWHHNARWWSYSEFALCRASCFFAYCEGLETTLNHNWFITFPYGLYDVKWRGGWWFRGVTRSQYVHLSMQRY